MYEFSGSFIFPPIEGCLFEQGDNCILLTSKSGIVMEDIGNLKRHRIYDMVRAMTSGVFQYFRS